MTPPFLLDTSMYGRSHRNPSTQIIEVSIMDKSQEKTVLTVSPQNDILNLVYCCAVIVFAR